MAGDEYNHIIRAVHPHVVATLVRVFGDVDLAEDMAQEAIIKALTHWPDSGTPQSPAAWLVTTAKHHAIDLHRKFRYEQISTNNILESVDADQPPDVISRMGGFEDDLLKLIFTCCHPDLPADSQVALTLKVVLGFSVNEIARSFLASPAAMERRLTRAKQLIRDRKVPYAIPGSQHLAERLEGVMDVIYLIFNRGYWAPESPQLYRAEVCDNAIRLARMLTRLFHYHPEIRSLLALMLLTSARSGGRVDANSALVSLEDQDHDHWNWSRIHEGRAILASIYATPHPPGNYQLQATISALHCVASDTPTDWPQIVELYLRLEELNASPVFTINRAVAMGYCSQEEAALEVLDSIWETHELSEYQPYFLCRAFLLERLGRPRRALESWQMALKLSSSSIERQKITAEINHLKDQFAS